MILLVRNTAQKKFLSNKKYIKALYKEAFSFIGSQPITSLKNEDEIYYFVFTAKKKEAKNNFQGMIPKLSNHYEPINIKDLKTILF